VNRRSSRPPRPLTAIELAEAAVLADVSLALVVLAWVFPLPGLILAMAVVPMATAASRHRLRAVVAAAVAGAALGFMVAGTGVAINAVTCAALGAVIGVASRRRWGPVRTAGLALVTVWPVVAGLTVAALVIFDKLRKLTLDQIVISWQGTARALRRLGFDRLAAVGDDIVHWYVGHWWLTIPLTEAALILVALLVSRAVAGPAMRRLAAAVGPPDSVDHSSPAGHGARPGPLPVVLSGVRFRYPDTPTDALAGVSLRFGPGRLTAVVGPNGSGKSSLVRILAGRAPTAGSIDRPGSPAPGRPGGTAMIFQRPESQVLGVRVRDDVVWGLAGGHGVDVTGLLGRVGLAALADRETSTLSGGELQRLALAAALARRPSLLLSDESTAMVDRHGRAQLVALMRETAAGGVGVVHVTHRAEEAAAADVVVALDQGRVVPHPVGGLVPANGAGSPVEPIRRPPLLELRGVGHVYSAGSPWSQRALEDVDLTIGAGESVLVVGGNGSGKSTLAWVLAGLRRPSEGLALLDGRPVSQQVGRVAMAFQHPRLQLLRPTVRRDVQDAGAVDAAAADEALALVGLDPGQVGDRRVDQLSGGQQRRVALAGLLARRPRLLVLDEPFAGLDERSRSGLIDVLVRLRRQLGLTLVLVSHDVEGTDRLVSRVVKLAGGRIVADSRSAPAAAAPVRPTIRPDNRREAELHLLRYVPSASPVHRLWAGTKLLAVAALSLALSIQPTWPAIALVGVSVAAVLRLAGIPRGAAPRLPRWFWSGILLGGAVSVTAGQPPDVHLAGFTIGLGGFEEWARFLVLGFVLLAAAAIVGWTTPLAEIAPALAKLARPLRWVRLPVDEWAVAVALTVRCLPLLVDELQTMLAARRLRRSRAEMGWRSLAREPQDLMAAALVMASRRAHDLAEAIDARGGLGRIADSPARPGLTDAVALALVLAVAAVAVLLG